ncbi:MAG TPA: SDR family NAD(P)-dependent oxidoreductase [Puia sp.]|jgi:NAD(P)-dependent dehydrogenase (short-subunit alcohol dehydrogenase family)
MDNQEVWLVTGAIEGLGRILVKQLLKKGRKVAAIAGSLPVLTETFGEQQPGFLPLAVDLTSSVGVEDAVDRVIAYFGKIDRVVNNAGYGLTGSLEELTDQEVRNNFDSNVFGTLNVIRAVMLYLREQGSGHIFNISAVGEAYDNLPGLGIHYATTLAVQGLTGSLAAEVKQFGIGVTTVSTGYFNGLNTPRKKMAAYRNARYPDGIDEEQDVHAEKIADDIIRTAGSPDAPLCLHDPYRLNTVTLQHGNHRNAKGFLPAGV